MKMKLYYSPGACPLASHIALIETNADFSLEKVDLQTHKTEKGQNYYEINPKGSVPLIELENGERLTENPAILQFIADQNPSAQLMPPPHDFKRYRVKEWLSFVGSEIHKSFSPLFDPSSTSDEKKEATETLRKKFAIVEQQLGHHPYLVGETMTVADIYLFVTLTWGEKMITSAVLKDFLKRMREKKSVQQALKEERPH